jgi:capsular polysaccharide transport system permease protein
MADDGPNPGSRGRKTPFVVSFAIQCRVIRALMLREMLTRYGRHNIGFLWLFIEPMMFTIGVTLIWTALKSVHGVDLPIAVFALTGYSCILVWRNIPSRAMGSIGPNLSLMYHRNVKTLDIFIARILLELIGVAASFFTLSLFFWAIGWIDLPENPYLVVEGWLMMAWFGAGLGLFLGAFSLRSDLIDKFWHPLTYFMFPFSGSAYLMQAAPTAIQPILMYVPMIHGVEWIREGFFGSHFTPMYSPLYLLAWNLVLTFFGLIELRNARKYIIPQ